MRVKYVSMQGTELHVAALRSDYPNSQVVIGSLCPISLNNL